MTTLDEIPFEDRGKYKIPYYIECGKWDLISKLAPWFEKGTLFIREDGKIEHKRNPASSPPWCYVRSMGKNCFLNHRIMFEHWKMIHSECQSCWKIVIEPRNVRELFQLYFLQRRLDYPSKCGTELDRVNSCKRYGGYFYCNSIEHGRARYKEVRAAVDEEISPDVPIILKRACTEFEQELGDSHKWTVTPEQQELEEIFRDSFALDVIDYAQHRHAIAHTHKQWIHTAYRWNDLTYLEFTGGNPLFPKLEEYHEG